jgi:hypothetical protein
MNFYLTGTLGPILICRPGQNRPAISSKKKFPQIFQLTWHMPVPRCAPFAGSLYFFLVLLLSLIVIVFSPLQ